jgi:hypothetical protein
VRGGREICKTQKDRDGAAVGFHRRRSITRGVDFKPREIKISLDSIISLEIQRIAAIDG